MGRSHRGRAFEWKVRDVLSSLGFLVVRAAASKGPADLVALRAERSSVGALRSEVYLVQVKLNRRLPPAERLELDRASLTAGAPWILARNIGEKHRHVVGFERYAHGQWVEFWLESHA